MNNKFNRVVATGLLALMIANFSACDEVDNGVQGVQLDDNGNGYNNSSITTMADDGVSFKGDVWEQLKARGLIYHNGFPYKSDDLNGYPLPITFLQEEGLLYYDRNYLRINLEDDIEQDSYAFSVRAFVDENTKDNDVYLYVNYRNQRPNENIDNKGKVYYTTWELKYTLSDDDYQTFLNLQNDWRIRLFVQQMDKIYQPEVINEASISYELLSMGSQYSTDQIKQYFPYTFASNIDWDNGIVTFGTISGGTIKYIDLDIRKSNAWEYAQTMDGIAPEDLENHIKIGKLSKVVGDCLVTFQVAGRRGGMSDEQAKEAFDNTTNVRKYTPINVNQTDNTYDYNNLR
ncbi:MAG: hypothetical protein IJ371_03835 [Clostridia bacterium]|nr:hypothetical protein [Clostridia bacterium]